MNPYDLIQGYWKLTRPDSGATEVKYPAIKTYTDAKWFYLNNTNDGVIFKAPSLGGTTTNSSNTRSELRELKADGTLAAWSTYAGTHSMEIECSVDVLPYSPKNKPHVVTGQIHDGSDDVTVFRVEGNADGVTAAIWITNGDTTHGYKLTDSYRIGAKYRVGFSVSGGVITYTFNGQPVAGYTKITKRAGCYFKCGCYNQDGGDTTPGVYAQVTVYAAQVCHSSTSSLTDGVCTGIAPGSTSSPTVTNPEPVEGPVVDLQVIIDDINAVQIQYTMAYADAMRNYQAAQADALNAMSTGLWSAIEKLVTLKAG